MGSLNMDGPYDFDKDSIDANITEISGGNFALGSVDMHTSNFHVTYVGRSDSNVKEILMQKMAEEKEMSSKYRTKNTSFKYSYATSPKEAFEKECLNYHAFVKSKKLTRNLHPEKLVDTDWKCPVCNE